MNGPLIDARTPPEYSSSWAPWAASSSHMPPSYGRGSSADVFTPNDDALRWVSGNSL